MKSEEKRKNIRVSFRTEITVSYDGRELHFGGDSVNLSMSGMLVASAEKIPLGTQCRVELNLTGTQETMVVAMQGNVVRHDPSGFGIHFAEMDLDSYSTLKEIVRHNTQDPDLI